ncbi:MAG: DUF2452 domain-containing protein [Gammaproteobacteria bacterium]|nr:DUF2452 domain-containing protein [Gammaproteobacteria bacterium]NNL50852.1 DUF2452 domain-containing protein [Woeseiaceae bacterium]
MVQLEHRGSGGVTAAPQSDGNPDGKGLNGFLLDWYQSSPRAVAAKPRRQVLAEFFTSMLVLSSAFKFRPTVGRETYLYWVDSKWSLSLIAPEQWSNERRAGFAGTCRLQPDMTWTIEPSTRLAGHNAVSNAIARFYDSFANLLDTELPLSEVLPFFSSKAPYYQRLYANALSRSIRDSVALGDQASSSCRQWRPLLHRRETSLPALAG